MIHEMKQGDTKPALRVQLVDADGTNPNLTGKTVTFRMAATAHEPIIDDEPATLVTAASGIVEYQWQMGDTDTAGHFKGEFVVNGEQTYPSGNTYIDIIIGSKLVA